MEYNSYVATGAFDLQNVLWKEFSKIRAILRLSVADFAHPGEALVPLKCNRSGFLSGSHRIETWFCAGFDGERIRCVRRTGCEPYGDPPYRAARPELQTSIRVISLYQRVRLQTAETSGDWRHILGKKTCLGQAKGAADSALLGWPWWNFWNLSRSDKPQKTHQYNKSQGCRGARFAGIRGEKQPRNRTDKCARQVRKML